MPPRPDDQEPTSSQTAASRVPPHNLQAEESLLGAMLLSAGAIADAVEVVTAVRLLQARARPRVRRDRHALRRRASRSTRSPSPTSSAAPACSTRSAGTRVLVEISRRTPAIDQRRPLRHASCEEYALLRRLIGVAGEIAELGYAVPDDVSKAARRRPSRSSTRSAERRVTDTIPEAARPARRQPRSPRAALRAGRRHHRHPHRLHRPRRPPVRASSRARSSSSVPVPPWARRRSRSAWPPTPRSRRPTRARPLLLARDEPPRADAAPPVRRGAGRLHARAQRPAAAEPTGRRSPRAMGRLAEAPDLDRRQPQPHGDGDPGQGPAAQEPGRRPRPHRRRLPPADDRPLERREPPGRGVRDQPWPQDPRPRARDARSSRCRSSPRALEMRADKRPMLADLRESGCDRAGRRRRDVHLPRRGLQPDSRATGHRRDHRGQAPQRPHRRRAASPSSRSTPGSPTWPGGSTDGDQRREPAGGLAHRRGRPPCSSSSGSGSRSLGARSR